MSDRRRRFTLPGRQALAAVCGVLLVTLAGCQQPRFEGPQLQDSPEGFLHKEGASSSQLAFLDREIVEQSAWTKGTGEPFSAIFITGYRGAATPEEVLEARDAQERRLTGRAYQFGPLERMSIDGREAWGWMVTQRDSRGLHSREFKVAIPYDTMTYTVEFFSNKPSLMSNPDTLRWGVASFAIGVTTLNRRAMVIGVALGGLILFLGVRKFVADPFAANRNVRLVEFTVPEPEEGSRSTPVADEDPSGGSRSEPPPPT